MLDGLPAENAVVIPQGASNGDVIKAVFPNADCEFKKFYEKDTVICDLGGFYIRISAQWWNSPYEGH